MHGGIRQSIRKSGVWLPVTIVVPNFDERSESAEYAGFIDHTLLSA